jgi:hypothetical protein
VSPVNNRAVDLAGCVGCRRGVADGRRRLVADVEGGVLGRSGERVRSLRRCSRRCCRRIPRRHGVANPDFRLNQSSVLPALPACKMLFAPARRCMHEAEEWFTLTRDRPWVSEWGSVPPRLDCRLDGGSCGTTGGDGRCRWRRRDLPGLPWSGGGPQNFKKDNI